MFDTILQFLQEKYLQFGFLFALLVQVMTAGRNQLLKTSTHLHNYFDVNFWMLSSECWV